MSEMENQDRFKDISPRVLNELDRILPDWQSKVQPGIPGTLNEETLIQYLKDITQYEVRRKINDKRTSLFIELSEYSDKGLDRLIEEFTSFAQEEMQKWIVLDNKLGRIIIEFRSRLASVDIDGMNQSLDLIASKSSDHAYDVINRFNGYVDIHLETFFKRSIDGKIIETPEELKTFLKDKVEKIKEENKRIADRQKALINNSVKKLIQSKVDKIKSEQLSVDALNRSDLFTDEEINSVREIQKQVVFEAIKDRYQSNMDMFNEATQKFIGVSGKNGMIQKLREAKDQLEGKDVAILDKLIQEVIPNVFDSGGILPGDYNPESRRIKRFTPADGACLLLDYAAFMLNFLAGDEPQDDIAASKDDFFYQGCTQK